MRKREKKEDFVWKLDIPLREGMYWRKSLTEADPSRALDIVSIENGESCLFIHEWSTGTRIRLGHYKPVAEGKFVYCGPDLAPPVAD